MDMKKDLSEIIQIVKNNGVSFVKLFFKSNLSYMQLNENEDFGDWVVDFSDGKNYLGSLSVSSNNDYLDSMTSDYVDPTYMIFCAIPIESNAGNLNISMKLIFSANQKSGKCYVYLT